MTVSETFGFYARWTRWWLKLEIRELWNAVPGPAWLKIAIVGICLAIPGPQDELLLLLVIAGCRAWKRHRARRTYAYE